MDRASVGDAACFSASGVVSGAVSDAVCRALVRRVGSEVGSVELRLDVRSARSRAGFLGLALVVFVAGPAFDEAFDEACDEAFDEADELDEVDEVEDGPSSAEAIADPFAKAIPMPSATANPPTRPMYRLPE